MAADLPSDPLLKSGSFIDTNGLSSNDAFRSAERPQARNGGAGPETPFGVADASASSAESKNRRRAAPQGDNSWLPSGWEVEDRVRTSGATAGSVDKYYFDPTSGRRFRSKKEVLYFIENGALPKKRKSENAETEKDNPGSSTGNKQKNSSSKKKTLKFDFANPPEEVSWVLANGSADTWDAVIGDEKVLKSTKEEWTAAFTSRSSSGNIVE